MAKRTLRVMWFVPPALEVVASWQDRDDLIVDAVRTQSSDEQFEALVNGSTDAVVTSIDNVLHWNQRPGPKDFVVVAQVERTTPLRLISRSTIKNVADLQGGHVLVDAPENGFVVALMAILKTNGLHSSDYSMLEAGGVVERYNSLIAGKGDATLLGPPFYTMALAQGLNQIASIQELYPVFPGQGVVIRRELAGVRIALQAWLNNLNEALKIVPANIDRLRQAYASQGLPSEAIQALEESVPTTLVPDLQGIQFLIYQRKELALVGAQTSYAKIVDSTYLI
ncbi:ABC transporter substrate-binding protein [Pseudomonas sp. Irchel s3f7]|uniref:ABC transporter substrate-binding protein n=1 Tax=Pseudomonas sp. Irchel s3f7 TaxID=2009153 RepID=UPI000BA40BE9|nr:ABC transporter substrate-binding protein [Pseudomonas sp. Irchel s3f7]